MPHFPGLIVEQVQLTGRLVIVMMRATSPTADCPLCCQPSDRIHSRYQRSAMDLPWADREVQLQLHVRRFRCLNPACARAIFAERLAGQVRPAARRSNRVTQRMLQHSLVLASETAAPQLTALGLPTIASTLLRLQRQAVLPPPPTVSIIGIDDFAFAKGRRYGALIVDLERHQPIEVLPDKQAATVAAWLQAHPEVTITHGRQLTAGRVVAKETSDVKVKLDGDMRQREIGQGALVVAMHARSLALASRTGRT